MSEEDRVRAEEEQERREEEGGGRKESAGDGERRSEGVCRLGGEEVETKREGELGMHTPSEREHI